MNRHTIAALTLALLNACTVIINPPPAGDDDTSTTSDADLPLEETTGDEVEVGVIDARSTSTGGAEDSTSTGEVEDTSTTGDDSTSTGEAEDASTSTTSTGDESTSDDTSTSTSTGEDMPCGNSVIDAGEDCDGDAPFAGVGCSDDCRYDFGAVPQLFCAGTCSWAGPSGCDQADADLFCQLRTGNPGAMAGAYVLGKSTDLAGFPCANPALEIELDGMDPRIDLGPLPAFGADQTVYYQTASIYSTHGGGDTSAIIDVTCI